MYILYFVLLLQAKEIFFVIIRNYAYNGGVDECSSLGSAFAATACLNSPINSDFPYVFFGYIVPDNIFVIFVLASYAKMFEELPSNKENYC